MEGNGDGRFIVLLETVADRNCRTTISVAVANYKIIVTLNISFVCERIAGQAMRIVQLFLLETGEEPTSI